MSQETAGSQGNTALKKRLGLFTIVCISAGSVLGGWLAEAPYWFEITGAGSAFVFPLLAVLLLPVAFAFAEQSAMLPFASSVGVWTANSMGNVISWATQWMFFLVQVVEPPLVAFIFVTVLGYFFTIGPAMQAFLAILIMLIWYVFSNFNIEITGRLAVIFFLGMTAITLVVAAYYFFGGYWKFENIGQNGGFFPHGGQGVVIASSVLVLKYIGLEIPPTLIQEAKFPPKKMVIAMLAGLFVPAVMYFLATMALGGLAPHQLIAQLAMPGPELVEELGMLRIFAILDIIAGLLFAFTTLMGFWVSSARVLYGASQLQHLPPIFQRTNRFGQPWVANIVVLGFGVFFAVFTGSNWVQYMYTLSVVAAGIVYLLVCLSALILRYRRPEWDRPFTLPAGKIIYSIGIIISVFVIVVGASELPGEAILPIIVYVIIGALIPLAMRFYRRSGHADWSPITLTPADADKES